MTNELVRYEDIQQIGAVLAKSGYFTDAKSEAQAIVKVLAGREIGIGAVASMSGIHIIQGKPAIGATLMAAMVKRSGKYDFKVLTLNDDTASIEFYQAGKTIGVSTFTAADAKRAGTQNMGKFPRNMLYARAMSNGVKWFCPDVFTGPIYEPGELGATVDYETGEVIDADYTVAETAHVVDGGQPEAYDEPTRAQPTAAEPKAQNGRPFDTDTLHDLLNRKAGQYRTKSEQWMGPPAENVLGLMVGRLNAFFSGADDRRHTFLRLMTGTASSKTLDRAMTQSLLDWIDKDSDMAAIEANRIVNTEIQQDMVGDLFDSDPEEEDA